MTDTAESAVGGAAARTPDDEPAPSSRPTPPPSRVYHYTTAAGLLGIVNGNRKDDEPVNGPRPLTFWASDLLDMNDATELAFGLELMRERAEQAGADSNSENTRTPLAGLLSFLEQYLGVPRLDANQTMEPRPSVCGTSFSSESDLLNQWVRYGDGGGFAIGIDGGQLRGTPCRIFNSRSGNPEDFPCSFAEIKYGEEARSIIDGLPFLHPKAATLLAFALGVAGLVSMGKAVWEGLKDPEHKLTPPPHPASPLVATAITAAAQCKDGAFSDEKEWRLLAGGDSPQFDKLLLSEDYPPKFRRKGPRLVPYRPITIESPDAGSLIRELVVGPAPDQARLVHAAQRLLVANGHNPRVAQASKIPYRGW